LVIFPTTGGFIGGIVIFSGNQFLGGQLLYLPYASQLYLAWQAYNVSILGSQIFPAARVSTTSSTTTVTNPSWGAPTIGSTCQFHIFNNNYAPNGGEVTITANPLDLNTDLVPKTNLITNTAAIIIPVRQYATFQMTVLDSGNLLALVPISPTLSITKARQQLNLPALPSTLWP